MANPKTYAPRKWANLKGLKGISDGQIENHFALYEGYVKNTNLLTEQLMEITASGKASGTNPVYAELTRRLGFEYNGMVLHEYYFDNMTPNGQALNPQSKLGQQAAKSFGSVDNFLADLKGVASLRGVGWAITYQDPSNGHLSNHWVTLHNDGNIAGFTPVLVLDVWEHAFIGDYKPTERGKYLEAFFQNVDWARVESRLK